MDYETIDFHSSKERKLQERIAEVEQKLAKVESENAKLQRDMRELRGSALYAGDAM